MLRKFHYHIVFFQLLFFVGPCFGNAAESALQPEKKSWSAYLQGLDVSLAASSQKEHEYSPETKGYVYTRVETSQKLKVTNYRWGPLITGIGWESAGIRQESDVFGDLDFDLRQQGPFALLQYSLQNNFFLEAGLAEEEFTDHSQDGFYQLNSTLRLYAGSFYASYQNKNCWLDFNYDRFSELEPEVDLAANRATLLIFAQNFYGLEAGWKKNNNLKISSSIIYEDYESSTRDQFNLNGKLSCIPFPLQPFEISLALGYYTAEQAAAAVLATDYNWRWQFISGSLHYRLEFAESEQSWLNQAELSLYWPLWQDVSLTADAIYGKENGADEDEFFNMQTGLLFAFF